MPRKSKITPFHEKVGTVPDRELSAMAGVSIATVCYYRQKFNIPSFRSTLPSATRSTVALSPATAGHGYLAKFFNGESLVLVAGSLHEAAVRCVKHGPTLSLSYVGPALTTPAPT